MATLSTVLAFSRAQAQTDSNGLTDAKGIIFANEALVDFRRQMISHGVDASQVQEAYRDGTASTGTYLYPTDMFFLKAIELNYANANEQDYKRATQVDVSNLPAGVSFGWLRKNADKFSPNFDDRGDWYEIFPTPVASDNLTAIIRIFYFLQPTEYTATSDTITYPETLDYRLLGWRIASNYYYSIGKINEGDMFNIKYQERVKELISTLGRGTQQPMQAVPIQLDGFLF
jgi:hypothetical protein